MNDIIALQSDFSDYLFDKHEELLILMPSQRYVNDWCMELMDKLTSFHVDMTKLLVKEHRE